MIYEIIWDFDPFILEIRCWQCQRSLWIRVYSPFEAGTTHHWCSNWIYSQGRRFATTFWTLHRVFMRPSQKSVARVHRPVASASAFCGRGILTALAASYFLPLSPPITFNDDCLICLYDELSIDTPIGHFLLMHLFYLTQSSTSDSQFI